MTQSKIKKIFPNLYMYSYKTKYVSIYPKKKKKKIELINIIQPQSFIKSYLIEV